MDHSNNIPETDEEDEVYDAIAGLLNKAISGTEQPVDESSRIELNNSVHKQMSSIENDIDDIDETLYEDDTTNSHAMHGGFQIIGSILSKGVDGITEVFNTAKDGVEIAIDGIERSADGSIKYLNNIGDDGKQIISEQVGTGFVAFEGIVPIKQSGIVFYNKIISFFTIRIVIEIFITILLVRTFLEGLRQGIFGESSMGKTIVLGLLLCLCGFKLVSAIFDKMIGNEIYSCSHIMLQIFFALLLLASSQFIKIIGCVIIIICIGIILLSFVLPSVPSCFNFALTLINYTDFEHYTKEIFSGIIGFVAANKFNDILLLILYIINIVLINPAALAASIAAFLSIFDIGIWKNDSISEVSTSERTREEQQIKNQAGGRKKNKRINK